MSGIRRTLMGHWVVEGDTGLSKIVEEHGTFEYVDTLRTIAAVARSIPDGGVVVDAGACIGDHTAIYSRIVGPHGKVYAFEPHPISYEALIQNTDYLSNVVTMRYALGSHRTNAMLSMTPNIGASFLGASEFPMDAVQVRGLDECLLCEIPRLDLMHLDAEGMEPQILKGAETLIRTFHPTLLIEVCDQWLRRYGSSSVDLLQQIAGYGYFTLLQAQPNPAQFDVIAMPVAAVVKEFQLATR